MFLLTAQCTVDAYHSRRTCLFFYAPQEVLRFVFIMAGRVHDAVIVTGGARLLEGYLCGSATHGIPVPDLPGVVFCVVLLTDQVPEQHDLSRYWKEPRPARPMSTISETPRSILSRV